MKLVVDANILFAALIKEGSNAKLLISDKLQLFSPEFLFEEFSKYEKLILKKTHRPNIEFKNFLGLLKEQITIILKKIIVPFFDKAEKISPDPKDTVYLALALAIKSNIWSNDKKLKEGQNKVKIFSTDELIKKIDFATR
ncbi:hypothetical protein LCGC14_1142180 [marine sediment metagenome]|uniref:PIN domain-containing protein n=1 Tax=marine sediment metagenome TaxID=412755 RepID=A0A0F9PG34_9ZZZZ